MLFSIVKRRKPGFLFFKNRIPLDFHDDEPAESLPIAPPIEDTLDDLKRFAARVPLDLEKKALTVIVDSEDKKTVIDYKGVTVTGYLSTFQNFTPSDRDGEYVEPGAFTDTIKEFQQNPIMLRDHRNSTENAIGRFTILREDTKGLYIEAGISDAPDCQSLRFKVAEGVLRTLSMGGIFHYKPMFPGNPVGTSAVVACA